MEVELTSNQFFNDFIDDSFVVVRNGDQTTVRLVLKDVNDNAPQMPSKPIPYEIDENADEVRTFLNVSQHFL
jgi:hypothetical protein